MSTEVVVDWHPFEYYTAHSFENGKHTFTETVYFETLPNGGTRVHDVVKAEMSIPSFIRRPMIRYMLISQHHFDEKMKDAARMAGEEFARTRGE